MTTSATARKINRVAQQSTAAAGAIAVGALGAADANAIIITDISSDTVTITQISQTADVPDTLMDAPKLGDSFTFDLNGDGFDDFGVSESIFLSKAQSGEIVANFTSAISGIKNDIGPNAQTLGSVFLAPGISVANKFMLGDTVDGSAGGTTTFGTLFSTGGKIGPVGNFPEGTDAFVGLALTTFIDNAEFSVEFGFASVTRASTTVNFIGFNAAPLPTPVPEPGSLALLAAGAAGLAAFRRRRLEQAK